MKHLSLRVKITLWNAAVLFMVLAFFGAFIYVSMSRVLYGDARNRAKAHAAQAEGLIDFEDDHVDLGELERFVISGTHLRVYSPKNRAIGGGELPSPISAQLPAFNRFRIIDARGNSWLVLDKRVFQDNKFAAWIRVARPLGDVQRALRNLAATILLAVPLAILIAVAGGLFLAKKALSPIDHITKTAAAIGRGDLSRRLKMPKIDDEVGRLAVVFDEMLDKLEAFVVRERQFTTDASHELRTPVTVISAAAQEALSGAKSSEELRAALTEISNACEKMGLLISALLKLTRSDEHKSEPAFERLDLGVNGGRYRRNKGRRR